MPKSKDPLCRTGVYKSIRDVPEHHRLHNFESLYADRDAWAEYQEAELADAAETVQYEANLVERKWKRHMDDRGRHHALATPADVESWCSSLLDRMAVRRAYNPYWVRLQEFYDYLLWHTDHPHVYHPPLMAAGNGDSAKKIWDRKMEGWDL